MPTSFDPVQPHESLINFIFHLHLNARGKVKIGQLVCASMFMTQNGQFMKPSRQWNARHVEGSGAFQAALLYGNPRSKTVSTEYLKKLRLLLGRITIDKVRTKSRAVGLH